MRHCLSLETSSPSSVATSPAATAHNLNSIPSPSQGTSADNSNTPTSSTHPSPTLNVTREYSLAFQTNSYNEIWSTINVLPDHQDQQQLPHHDEESQHLLLSQLLQPNRQCVQDALLHARPNTLTRLVSSYFDHSENTSHLCILLHQSLHRARALYTPIHDLLELLPTDTHSLTQSHCNLAFQVFQHFDSLDNPFPCPDSHNFAEIRNCFSKLNQQVDLHLHKSRSRIHLLRRATTGSALCIIGTVVGVAITAVAITTHALIALVATPCFTAFSPRKFTKKQLSHISQLNAAARGTYVLNNDLATIDSLVARLYTAVEGDKFLIRLGLERGSNKHAIQEVVKQLRRNHPNFIDQIKDLEERVYLCLATVNRARSLLLQEIHLHQSL